MTLSMVHSTRHDTLYVLPAKTAVAALYLLAKKDQNKAWYSLSNDRIGVRHESDQRPCRFGPGLGILLKVGPGQDAGCLERV